MSDTSSMSELMAFSEHHDSCVPICMKIFSDHSEQEKARQCNVSCTLAYTTSHQMKAQAGMQNHATQIGRAPTHGTMHSTGSHMGKALDSRHGTMLSTSDPERTRSY